MKKLNVYTWITLSILIKKQILEQTITDGIFEHIGRVIFFHCEADVMPFEHRDLDCNNGLAISRSVFIDVLKFFVPSVKTYFFVFSNK